MDYNRIAVRYAKALLKAAKEENKADVINTDLLFIKQTVETKEFQPVLENPVYTSTKKNDIFKAVFEGKINDLSLRFLYLLTNKNRENILPDAIRNYGSIYRKEQNISSVKLTTAFKSSPKFNNEVKQIIEKKFKTKAELITVEDKDIIGGFIINIDDRQLDAGIKNQLNNIKKELISD